MADCCRNEFYLKNFGFQDCKRVRFYKSQWTDNRGIFLIIKLVLMLYWLGWFVAGFTVPRSIERWWIFLTNWGVTLLLIYFLSSFALVFYGAMIDNKTRDTEPDRELRWFHIFVWIFHEVAFAMALFITVLFWSLLAPANLNASVQPISINSHLINLIIILVDLFVCDIPFRLLHFYHTSIGAVVYIVFSLILHGTGYTSAIYPVLDWANRTGLAIGLAFGTVFVAVPIAHSIGFGLYHLRWFIARKCCKNKNSFSLSTSTTNQFQMKGKDNTAFSA